MKVVILSTATAYAGGAIITLLNVLPQLQKKGVQPYFILKGHGQLENVLCERGIPYSVIRSYDWCVPEEKRKGVKNHLAWIIKSIINLVAECKTYLLLKKQKADIYHLNCIYNGTGVVSARILKIPVIWHLREFVDIYGETPVFWNTKRAWEKINFANKVICVSEYLKQAYESKILDKSKICVICDGINMSNFSEKEPAKTEYPKIVIGLAGTAPIKNHKDAILALQKVRQRGHRVALRIAGRWNLDAYNQKYKDSLKRLITECGIEDDVEFVGMIEDMNSFWGNSDLSVVCSRRESFGLAATEAMACKVPLICSNTSVSGELTQDGENILVYKTGDAEALAECILKCINEFGTTELEIRTRRAAKFVRENFSIDITARKIKAVYDEVM